MTQAAWRTYALLACFARRDFLRFALFLWMIPRAAALSNAEAACFITSGFAAGAAAFLKMVFNLVLTSRFRLRRFSDARVHFRADLILGNNISLQIV